MTTFTPTNGVVVRINNLANWVSEVQLMSIDFEKRRPEEVIKYYEVFDGGAGTETADTSVTDQVNPNLRPRQNGKLSTAALLGTTAPAQESPGAPVHEQKIVPSQVTPEAQPEPEQPRSFTRRKLLAAGAALVLAAGGAVFFSKRSSGDEEQGSRPAAVATAAPGEATTAATPNTAENTHAANEPTTLEEANDSGYALSFVNSSASMADPVEGQPEIPAIYDKFASTEFHFNNTPVKIPRIVIPGKYAEIGDKEHQITPGEVEEQILTTLSAIFSTEVSSPEYLKLVDTFTQDTEVANLLKQQAQTLQARYPGKKFFLFQTNSGSNGGTYEPSIKFHDSNNTPIMTMEDVYIRAIDPNKGLWGNSVNFRDQKTFVEGAAAKLQLKVTYNSVNVPNDPENIPYLSAIGFETQVNTAGNNPVYLQWFPINASRLR